MSPRARDRVKLGRLGVIVQPRGLCSGLVMPVGAQAREWVLMGQWVMVTLGWWCSSDARTGVCECVCGTCT